jgi:hypothetical protein
MIFSVKGSLGAENGSLGAENSPVIVQPLPYQPLSVF